MQEIMTGQATPAQIGAFLVSLKVDTLNASILYSVAQKMVSFALPCPVSGDIVLDVVGTGGDKWDTFNISTAAAITLGSLGIKVAKHGNRSQSGRIGSADFLEGLGANIMLDEKQTASVIDQCGFGFLFVQKFHPAMKFASPVRKEIGVRNIFNVLGPLVNPALPTHFLIGVSVESLGPVYSQVLALNPRVKKAMVVHSVAGMDEIGLDCETLVWLVEGGKVTKTKICPADFGLETRPIESVFGGKDAKENAQIFRDILHGKESVVAYTDWLCINSACALVLCDKAKTYKEGVEITRNACRDGSIAAFLEKYINLTNLVK